MPNHILEKLAERPIPKAVKTEIVPEIYGDYVVSEFGDEVVHVQVCRKRPGHDCEVVATVIMPLSGWMQSHAWHRAQASKNRGN